MSSGGCAASETGASRRFPRAAFWLSSDCCRQSRIAAQVAVAAVVVETLGQGSRAATSAREKGNPTIAEIPGILALVGSGNELLVDGFAARW